MNYKLGDIFATNGITPAIGLTFAFIVDAYSVMNILPITYYPLQGSLI